MPENISSAPVQPETEPWGRNVTVEFENGIAWVSLNRPTKRNAISPDLSVEMLATLDVLEFDPRCGVLVLTGAGGSFSAGADLKEYVRNTWNDPAARERVFRVNGAWTWQRLLHYRKPTIAMVHGWCLGMGLVAVAACDIAIAADDAKFGAPEINWGVIAGGVVPKAMSSFMNHRAALYYIMTGETFDGRQASAFGLVTESVAADRLRARTTEIATILLQKNPVALQTTKSAFKYAVDMTWSEVSEYVRAKVDQGLLLDDSKGKDAALRQFLDDKTIRPGVETYVRPDGTSGRT
jgi:trans-feruloyl-CoA hydratase/vanillin synthase